MLAVDDFSPKDVDAIFRAMERSVHQTCCPADRRLCVWACDRFAKMLVVQSECENPNNLEKSVQDFRYAVPAPADPNAIKL
jgi:hypothetical protein